MTDTLWLIPAFIAGMLVGILVACWAAAATEKIIRDIRERFHLE